MTKELLAAFKALRINEQTAVLQSLDVRIPHHVGETNADFCTKAVRHICAEGMVRELETAMLRFQ